MNRFFAFVVSSVFFVNVTFAQDHEPRNWQVDGYLVPMNSFMFADVHDLWQNDFLLHNRLNFHWFINNGLSFELGLRARFLSGDMVKYVPGYDKLIGFDSGTLNLSRNVINEKSVILNEFIDRLSVEYQKDKWNIKVGRQRINWAKTFAWNPNDIFNTYSFFDFDYEEKPGSDAVLVQYWLGYTSDIQIAAKLDANDKVTTAVKSNLNWKNYDIQFLAGVLAEDDWVLGAGWAGGIKNIDFRGELSYFFPVKESSVQSDVFIGTVGLSYSFPNSFFVQSEAYFSSRDDNTADLTTYLLEPMNVKNMSLSRVSYLLSMNYPVTPLFSFAVSGMYFPEDDGFYAGPTLEYSLSDNISASFVAQHFELNRNNAATKQQMTMAFLRFKLSF